MTANQAEYLIQLMSRTVGVSRSGFDTYQGRPPSARQVADDALTDRIATIHEASKQTYGAPRIHAELAEEGVQVGRKRIERLLKAKGLKGVSRRKFVVTTERDPRARPANDLVDRNFYAPSHTCEHVLPDKGCPECALGCRHHRCADLGRLSVSGSGSGCLQPPHHRLGYGQRSESTVCHRCDEHGGDTAETRQRHPPLRPGIAIHICGVRTAMQRNGRAAVDGVSR